MNVKLNCKAVLDANVLYPAPLRDFLLRIAHLEVYEPIWTREIQYEWVDNLLRNRKDIDEENLSRTVNLMNKAFPKANVKITQKNISALNLPDKGDRHVLAAGIKSNSEFIVTNNLKDFPKRYLQEFNIIAVSPDDFVSGLVKECPEKIINAFYNQLKSLKNPPVKKEQLLEILFKNGMRKTVKQITI